MTKRFFLISILIFTCANFLYTQTFTPLRKLYVIETEKFDIVFPEESRRTAEHLASFADEVYDINSKLLNSTVYSRITVTITPDINIFNAVAYPAPYPFIIMYDTPMSQDFTTYKDNFYSIFKHELTHLLTLASANAGIQTSIFGTWLALTFVNIEPIMIEGVAVSFESLDGFGRANDPLIKQIIRQDIREGVFKTPYQASFWSGYPRGIFYEYGGLFSKYLQDTYGMEKYALFWRRLQTRIYISLFSYRFGMYKIFEDVYGIKFIDAWASFKQDITVLDVSDNYEGRITKKEALIPSLDSFENKVYYADLADSKLKLYDSLQTNKKIKNIVGIDKTTATIDVSSGGDKILLSSIMYKRGFYEYIVKEYDLENKKHTKLKLTNINSARYFKDGVVGISKDLHNSTLIYITPDGITELLLPPSYQYAYSSPVAIDDENIALIVTEEGIKSIRIYNYENKTLSKIETNNDELFRYVRTLNYADSKLFFSYDNDDRFYKLAILDMNTKEIKVYKTDYSGGVFNSIATSDGSIFYKATFSEYEALMKYNENDSFDILNYDYGNILDVDASIQNISGTFVPDESINVEKFNGMNYFKPWAAWAPIPLINDGFQYLFNGVGVLTFVSSPTFDDNALIILGYDIPYNFLQASIDYNSLSLRYPLRIIFDNKVVYAANPFWQTSIFLGMSIRTAIKDDKNTITFTPSVSALIFSETNHTSSTAFNWKYEDWSVVPALSITYSYRSPSLDHFREDIIKLNVTPTYSINFNSYRFDSSFMVQTRYSPIRLSLYGSYVVGAMRSFNGSSRIFGSSRIRGAEEFDSYVDKKRLLSNWLAGGELEFIWGFDADFNLGLLYFNNFFVSTSYRATYYDFEYLHSVAIKGGTSLFFVNPVVGGSPFILLALRLPNSKRALNNYLNDSNNLGILNHIYIGFGFDLTF